MVTGDCKRLEKSLPSGTCCWGQDLGQGQDQVGMEVPVSGEAQSIVFSKVFPKSALSPVSLHPPSFRLC